MLPGRTPPPGNATRALRAAREHCSLPPSPPWSAPQRRQSPHYPNAPSSAQGPAPNERTGHPTGPRPQAPPCAPGCHHPETQSSPRPRHHDSRSGHENPRHAAGVKKNETEITSSPGSGLHMKSVAGVPGLEPRTTEPESAVLPITPYPIGRSASTMLADRGRFAKSGRGAPRVRRQPGEITDDREGRGCP